MFYMLAQLKKIPLVLLFLVLRYPGYILALVGIAGAVWWFGFLIAGMADMAHAMIEGGRNHG